MDSLYLRLALFYLLIACVFVYLFYRVTKTNKALDTGYAMSTPAIIDFPIISEDRGMPVAEST